MTKTLTEVLTCIQMNTEVPDIPLSDICMLKMVEETYIVWTKAKWATPKKVHVQWLSVSQHIHEHESQSLRMAFRLGNAAKDKETQHMWHSFCALSGLRGP